MKRPKVEDFKVEYIKGCAEISSVIKQYSKAQDLYINELEQLKLCGVSRPFKTKFELAEFMHNEYEKHAQKVGWNTQETCKVEFLDLPKENKKTMLLVAESVLNAY